MSGVFFCTDLVWLHTPNITVLIDDLERITLDFEYNARGLRAVCKKGSTQENTPVRLGIFSRCMSENEGCTYSS